MAARLVMVLHISADGVDTLTGRFSFTVETIFDALAHSPPKSVRTHHP